MPGPMPTSKGPTATSITNQLVVPVLTGAIDALAMYGYYKGNGGTTKILGMEMSDYAYVAFITATASAGAEFFGDTILPKLPTGPLSADTIKMLYEPSVVGLANYGASKLTESWSKSGFVGPFAIGAGSNVAASYTARTITSSYK